MTLDSPHSGIADTAGVLHGVAFPVGQDSAKFNGCSQVSCHVLGEDVALYSAATLARLGLQDQEGENAALLANTINQLPAIPFYVGIGNVQKKSGNDWRYGTGDDLISFAGQRLLPADGNTAALRQTAVLASGTVVTEQLLGFVDGISSIRPNQRVPASQMTVGDRAARNYDHTLPDDRLDLLVTEAAVQHIRYDGKTGQCFTSSNCLHASWRLLSRLLGAISPTFPLPHTGITASQCYQAGSNALVSCTSAEAIALSGAGKQDGMYTTVNPMSYSRVGTYGLEECVQDNVTGLMWEGKPTSGLRSSTSRYTNWGDGRSGDASEYVAAVNATALCGHSDWRLPTVDELETLVDSSRPYPGPTIRNDWFPNTAATLYWASSPYVGLSYSAWYVNFYDGYVDYSSRDYSFAVRLVRASQ